MRNATLKAITCLMALALAGVALADQQQMAPGSGIQNEVAIDTGADGICDTTAAEDDIQVIEVGSPPTYQPAIRCGGDKIADSTAAGDDTQLVAVGASCKRNNTVVVDTGPDPDSNSNAVAPILICNFCFEQRFFRINNKHPVRLLPFYQAVLAQSCVRVPPWPAGFFQ